VTLTEPYKIDTKVFVIYLDFTFYRIFICAYLINRKAVKDEFSDKKYHERNEQQFDVWNK